MQQTQLTQQTHHYQLIATCPEEVREVLAEELRLLGAQNIVPGHKAVTFQVSEENFYHCHLKTTCATQLLMMVKKFSAKTPEMVFDQVRRIDWTQILDPKQSLAIRVSETAVSGPIAPAKLVQKILQGIKESFSKKSGAVPPPTDIKNPDVELVAFLHQGYATLSLNTGGLSLHKRGHHLEGHPAPLKETLAAAILRLSGYHGQMPLLDPMCGSGTLVVEAASLCMAKPCQIHRKQGTFGFERMKFFNRNLWRTIQEQARLERKDHPEFPLWASDINKDYIQLAQKISLRARVERHIQFQCRSFFDLEKPAPQGLLVANLPYGERLSAGNGNEEELRDFYKKVGDTLKKNFQGWKAALLVAETSPWKFIGLHPTRKIPLKNGPIDCKLLLFDLYEGSRKKTAKTEET